MRMWPGQFMGLRRYIGVVQLHGRVHVAGVEAFVAGGLPEIRGAATCGV